MTDILQGENPVRAKQRKKENCLTADVRVSFRIEVRNSTTLQPISSWKKGDKLVSKVFGTMTMKPYCENFSCEGGTGFLGLQGDCDYRCRETNEDFSWGFTSDDKLIAEVVFKVGCCSKKCAKKRSPGEISSFDVEIVETVIAKDDFTDRDNYIEGVFNEVYGGGDVIDYEAAFTRWFNELGGTLTGASIAIDPGGILDQNFKRPCGE
tara:strand:- start:617 stop:1240 length:624 start_codon:yes stop_codon:yes gene_type:complete